MKKSLFTLIVFCVITLATKAQSHFSYDLLLGVSPNTGQTFTAQKGYQNIFTGIALNYKIAESPFQITSGVEVNIENQNMADFLRIPLKLNYTIGQERTFYIGAGASYNYTISAFTNVNENQFDLLFETGTNLVLNQTLSLVPKVSYSYGLNELKYDANTTYRINYLMVALALRFHPTK